MGQPEGQRLGLREKGKAQRWRQKETGAGPGGKQAQPRGSSLPSHRRLRGSQAAANSQACKGLTAVSTGRRSEVGKGETAWQGDKGTWRGGAAAFPEGCPARRAPEVTPSLALLHSHLSRQFPIQGWPLGLSPSRATSCASVSSSQNGGDSEGTAFRAASQALGANLLPASTPPLQASVPEGPLPSPAPSAAAPGLCPLPSPLLGVRPPPAGRSSAQQSRQPLQRPVCPLVGALWIPLPARDLSQRKSLAAEAGGGPISASWSATLFIILKEEFGRLVWLWQAVGWAPGVSNPSCPPPCTPPARSWAQGA